MGTQRFDGIEELIGDDPEMAAFVEQAVEDMRAASFLLALSVKLDTWGHPDDAEECRRVAEMLNSRE